MKIPPLPLLTFQNVCSDFAAFCAVCFCHFLLLLAAGFSFCVLFFLLCVLLLLPFFRFAVVHGVAFVAVFAAAFDAAAGAFKSPTVEKRIFARY